MAGTPLRARPNGAPTDHGDVATLVRDDHPDDDAFVAALHTTWASLRGPVRAELTLRDGKTLTGPWYGLAGASPVLVNLGPLTRAAGSANHAAPVRSVAVLRAVREPVRLPHAHGIVATLSTQRLTGPMSWRVLNALWEAVPAGAWITLYGPGPTPTTGPWKGLATFGSNREMGVRLDPRHGRTDDRPKPLIVALGTVRHVIVHAPAEAPEGSE